MMPHICIEYLHEMLACGITTTALNIRYDMATQAVCQILALL